MSCADLERANVPDQSGSFDGSPSPPARRARSTSSVSAGNGYRDRGAAGRTGDLLEPRAPAVPDAGRGRSRARTSTRASVGLKVTKDGALVQSFRTTVRSTQTMRGKVAVDAKLDDMEVQGPSAARRRPVQVPGATLRAERRDPEFGDRGRCAPARSKARRFSSSFVGFTGGSTADGFSADRATDQYVQRFPDLVREEKRSLSPARDRVAVARCLREGRLRAAERHDQGAQGDPGNGHPARRGQRRGDRGEGEVDPVRTGEGDVLARRDRGAVAGDLLHADRRGQAEAQGQVPRDVDGGRRREHVEPGDRGSRSVLQGDRSRVHRPARARRPAGDRHMHTEHLADELDDLEPSGDPFDGAVGSWGRPPRSGVAR